MSKLRDLQLGDLNIDRYYLKLSKNKIPKRDFNDEKLYEILFKLVQDNKKLNYKSVQDFMFQNKLLEEDHSTYYGGGQRILKQDDYAKFLEIHWGFMRKGLLTPNKIDSYGNQEVFSSGLVSDKGKKYFDMENPIPFSDLMNDDIRENLDRNPYEILKEANIQLIDNAVNYYRFIKDIFSKYEDLSDEEKIFLSQEFYKKKWNPLDLK